MRLLVLDVEYDDGVEAHYEVFDDEPGLGGPDKEVRWAQFAVSVRTARCRPTHAN